MIVSGKSTAAPAANENMASEVNPMIRRILEHSFGMEVVNPVRTKRQNYGTQ
jgi:hypothetical protein